MPKFEHKVSFVVQIKNETEGELSGEWILTNDDNSGFVLKPMGQIDMFEEDV